jgi:hypothetical protein
MHNRGKRMLYRFPSQSLRRFTTRRPCLLGSALRLKPRRCFVALAATLRRGPRLGPPSVEVSALLHTVLGVQSSHMSEKAAVHLLGTKIKRRAPPRLSQRRRSQGLSHAEPAIGWLGGPARLAFGQTQGGALGRAVALGLEGPLKIPFSHRATPISCLRSRATPSYCWHIPPPPPITKKRSRGLGFRSGSSAYLGKF